MTAAPAETRLTGAESVIWNLGDLYTSPDDPAIALDMDTVRRQAEALAERTRGRVAALSAAEMLAAVQAIEDVSERMGRLGSFAGLRFAEDSRNPANGAFLQKVTEFGAQIDQILTFFELEWNLAPEDHVQAVLADPLLAHYRHLLEARRRYQPYQLSEPEEILLTEKSVTGRDAWVRFFTQLMGALQVDLDGQTVQLASALNKLHSPDRALRQRAQEAVTAALKARSMELTYVINTVAADKASDDRLRSYPSWITARNLANKAPDAVVQALVDAVTSQYDLVARHYDLKRRLLGLDELTDYDRYAPLQFRTVDEFYTWDEARRIVIDAFTAFSPRVAEIADRFFSEQWIHAPVQPGKRNGAFCSYTSNKVHPYILMNYEGRARDVQTLAHELGHGIHAYLAGQKQGFFGMFTPLTTAEMASTFGEMLVFSDMMARQSDKETRLAMLAGKVEDTFATVFRQISMNRFEDALHSARRGEGELTTERINALWLATQQAMFGSSVRMTDNYAQWWSYVGHFIHTPGYVYAYAFGELLVLALYKLYQTRGADFVPQFIGVLEAGDSDWPEAILAGAGVDLSDLGFWNQGLAAIRALVDEEEALARELFPQAFA